QTAKTLDDCVELIQAMHDEPERDASGYRRYGADALVVLGRITRLRAAGLSLRAIRPLLTADDGGAALRAALQDLDESLADEIAERAQRRALIEALLEERIEDPLEVTAADAAEERAIAFLRGMIPEPGPEEEAFERRFQRLMAAFRPPGAIDDAYRRSAGDDLDELLLATAGRDGYVDRFRRMFALRDAEATDPRVEALAADMQTVMRTALAHHAGNGSGASPELEKLSAQDLQQWMAGLEAAAQALPPAVRRVWELVFIDMITTVSQAKAAG
ncbi:MAG: MerR family transcriptional regulator, partial [Solirubrobacterales bacterium]|nr:MerR family transcriptional regulator [Solirubrobacterales bacterium]